ncbi:MAG: hypothetical protein JSR66_06785 [Proteobacteria bacterium]|nr:hypothetical protein [Pseudomonadota bacterium]
MSQGSISIVPIFATPLAIVTVPAAPQTNERVAQLFAQHVTANPAPPGAARLSYQSADDLLDWTDEPVRQLCGEILRGVWSTAAAVTTLTAEQLKSLSMQARAAFTIVQPNGCVPATSHSLTAWCGIYCLQAPTPAPQRGDSGVVRFYESRFGAMLSDATSSAMRVPFTSGHYTWRATPGQLIVFPGSLSHEIPLIRSDTPLVFIAVRTRFVGPGQEGLSRW